MISTSHAASISKQLGLRVDRVNAAIELLDEGNTIPFIARYRKEATGTLDEEQLRHIESAIGKLRALDERRATILASIAESGNLTDDLRLKINQADSLTILEDLYQPYKPKRRTRASIAREKGLQGLADLILSQARTKDSLEKIARSYFDDQVNSVEDALAGARDIVAEVVSDHPEVRTMTREKAGKWGVLQSRRINAAEDPRRVYELYYEFDYQVDRVRPHQVLAMNRGESEKVLRVKLEVAERDWRNIVEQYFRTDPRSVFSEQLVLSIQDAAERLLLPTIERDTRRMLTERAGIHAIKIFQANLRALLSQPPISNLVVMGIDPGFRTGCKVAVVDITGKVLATGTIYPHEPQKKWDEALDSLSKLTSQFQVSLISIGNGTASRETEQLAVQLIKNFTGDLHYVITSEAGASVYSASPLARNELPGLDVSLRGAVSIARRVQDPLAELVKIDPKSIGVGLYQHDVDQGQLTQSLNEVVESVVNQVGVDINTASPALLTYVSGIGPKLAERVVAYRDENGRYTNRNQIKKVSGLGPKAFEQSAGFLRIRGGDDPLDETAIHPESYPVARTVMKMIGEKPGLSPEQRRLVIDRFIKINPLANVAAGLDVGVPTLQDILEQLARPGRDPRQDMPKPILRTDILKMEDLTTGMQVKGTVRNVVDFGAFVDIGVKQDGLLHRSQIPPGVLLSTGDIVNVEILVLDPERDRISLKWIS